MRRTPIPMMTRRSIFLTGGSGYLGSALLRELLRRGHRVTAFVRERSQNRLPWHEALRVVTGDLTDPNLMLPTERFDAIVHCAAMPKLAGASQIAMEQANVAPVEFLAAHAKRTGVARFLHVSTAFVGADDDGVLAEASANEESCSNTYEKTKTKAEGLLLGRVDGLEVFRPGIILPEWMSSREEIEKSPLGPFFEALDVTGRGTCRLGAQAHIRPGFCRRTDVVRFIAGRLEAAPKPNSLWNLVSPERPTVAEIGRAFVRAGLAMHFEFLPRSRHPMFRPWDNYLSRDRRWEQTNTCAEANRIIGGLNNISETYLEMLGRSWLNAEILKEVSA
ncbi:SDR family oxidoreductase [bacterium]|nr:SDR family oxidoreductase [bacterium]